jgi:DNA anti-recombination protein RmuC
MDNQNAMARKAASLHEGSDNLFDEIEKEICNICSEIRAETIAFETEAIQILKEMKKDKDVELRILKSSGQGVDDNMAKLQKLMEEVKNGLEKVHRVCQGVDE